MTTTAFITHRDCWLHDMGTFHPECPDRLAAINDRLIAAGLDLYLSFYDAPLASAEQILRVPPGQIGDLYPCLQIVPDRLQVGRSGDRLGESLSGIGVGVEDLPREIVCLHPVAIDQLQVADAAAGQLHRYRGA